MGESRTVTKRRPTGDADRLWTVHDVAAYLGFHVKTVSKMAREGVLPSLKIGGALRFRRADIDVWLDGRRRSAS